MRRFECLEGTSNKFWEIALEGESFSVRFGRLGTTGQSQVKTFPSAEKARAEHDRLVREKVGKGYREMGVDAVQAAASSPVAPAASPAPRSPAKRSSPGGGTSSPATTEASPAVAALPGPLPTQAGPAAPDEPRLLDSIPVTEPGAGAIAWTDAVRRKIHPRRGGTARVKASEPRKSFEKIVPRYRQFAEELQRGVRDSPPDCKPLVASARARLEDGYRADPGEVEVQAVLATMCAVDDTHADSLVEYWAGTAGPAYALEALVRSWSFSHTCGYTTGGEVRVIGRQAPDDEGFGDGRLGGWRALRTILATAEPGAHDSALAVARRLWDDAPPLLRCALAYAFPDQPWGAQVAEDALAARHPQPQPWLCCLLASVDDARLLERILAAILPDCYSRIISKTSPVAYIPTMVETVGLRAWPLLGLMLSRATTAADRRDIAEGMALFDTSEAGCAFAGFLGDKVLRGIATEYFRTFPHRAAKAGEQASGRGAAATAVRAVIQAAQPPQVSPTEEASPGELPAVLIHPPWISKAKRVEPVVVPGLDMLPRPETIAWAPQEEEAYRKEFHPAKNVAYFQKEIESRIASSGSVNFFYLLRLPVDMALGYLETQPGSAWYNPDPKEVLALVSVAGIRAIPGLLQLFSGAPVQAAEVMKRIDSPRVAPAMADALVRLKKVRSLAEKWLLEHAETAAVGLLPAAVGPVGRVREASGTALRFLARCGHQETLRKVAVQYGEAAMQAANQALAQDPLQVLPVRLPRLPSFWTPAAFTRPLLRGGKPLPLPAIEALGTMLAFSTLEEPYAGIEVVRASTQPASLSAFALDLFEAWLQSGAPAREQWAFTALAFLGGDAAARRLGPLLRAWPGEGASARATLGLDILAAIGTDVALVYLNGIAEKVRHKALQDRAREKIGQIADGRGMSDDELSDRLAPHLGLDSDGTMSLDFGPRAFRVGFDEHLQPFAEDATGARLADLPKPTRSDDGARAEAATARWKALKKDARAVASLQIARLQRAMTSRRRWDAETFRVFLVEHPLVRWVARRLLWGVYDASGALEATFRIAEDGSLADSSDTAWCLPEGAVVGLVHPLELRTEEAKAWNGILADYAVLQPFSQMGRRCFACSDDVAASSTLPAMAGRSTQATRILSLESRGWRRGDTLSGVICEYEKSLPGGITVTLALTPGVYLAAPRESGPQVVSEVRVKRADPIAPARFGDLHPVVYSEILADLGDIL